jgi:S-ribosylhomocysteine lyase
MQKIQSFQIDHNKLEPGMYISRIDGDITTYDLRTRRPNSGSYMDNSTMHSLEHMAATFLRNSSIKDQVIYFGPMGCQTGFYLLIRNADHQKVREVLKQVLRDTISHEGEVFGCSPTECGNYRTLDIEKAKAEAGLYLDILEKTEGRSMEY